MLDQGTAILDPGLLSAIAVAGMPVGDTDLRPRISRVERGGRPEHTARDLTSTALTLWMLASPSVAGTLAIDFAFDRGQAGFGTIFPVVGVATATSFSGTARIVLEGLDSLGAITAPMPTAALQVLSLELNFSASRPPLPAVESAQFSQVSAAAGSFDGTTLRLPARAFAFQASLPPLTGPAIFPSSEAVLDLFFLDMPGAAQLLLRGGGTAGSNTMLLLTFDVEGREIARTFSAPEVPEMGLLGIGLLLLGVQVVRRRGGDQNSPS